MNRWRELGATVAAEQNRVLAQSQGQADERARFLAGLAKAPERRPTRGVRVAYTLAAIAAVFLAVWGSERLWKGAQPAELTAQWSGLKGTVASGAVLATQADAETLIFSDGSQVTVGRHSRSQLLQLSQNGAHLRLEKGQVTVAVQHRSAGDWRVEAGPFSIKVTGTKFRVAWSETAGQLEVSTFEGEVRIGRDGDPLLTSVPAGETIRLQSLPRPREEVATAPAFGSASAEASAVADPGMAPATAPDAVPSVAPGGGIGGRRSEPGDWRSRVKKGDYQGAWELVAPERATIETRGTVDELLALADAARFSSHPSAAHSVYETLRRRFPGGAAASTAAFQLARMAGATRDAVRWYQVSYDEAPGGPLAAEALGRRMEVLSRLGDRQAAASVARTYLTRFSRGPHATLAQSLTGN